GRASTDVIRASSDCAVVEGAFDLSGAQGSSIRERLVELDIDCEDTTLVIRRVVSRTGRNKVLLNGSLATVATLRELLRGMIDISGQHERYSLLDPGRHVLLLDRFAGTERHSRELGLHYARLQSLRDELETLRQEARDRLSRIDFLRFQLNEIDNAELVAGEEERLTDELTTLQHAETLRELTGRSTYSLYESDGAVIELIDQIARELRRNARHSARLAGMADTL